VSVASVRFLVMCMFRPLLLCMFLLCSSLYSMEHKAPGKQAEEQKTANSKSLMVLDQLLPEVLVNIIQGYCVQHECLQVPLAKTGTIRSVQLHDDSRQLIIHRSWYTSMCDSDSGAEIQTIKYPAKSAESYLSPDGSMVLINQDDNKASTIDTVTWLCRFLPNEKLNPTQRVSHAQFSSTGKYIGALLCVGNQFNYNVCLYDPVSRELVACSRNLNHGARVALARFAFSADDSMIAVTDVRGFISLFQTANLRGKKHKWHSRHRNTINSLCFSSDNKNVVTGSLDTTIRLWDIASDTCRWTSKIRGKVAQVKFGFNDTLLAAIAINGTMRFLDRATGTVVSETKVEQSMPVLAVSHDGHMVAACGRAKAYIFADPITYLRVVAAREQQKRQAEKDN
jgi:WD40 domain-containing protein